VTCFYCHLKRPQSEPDRNNACRYDALLNTVLVPVFCVCMTAALGIAAGMRQVVFMQFDVDADTEYIRPDFTVWYSPWLFASNNTYFDNKKR